MDSVIEEIKKSIKKTSKMEKLWREKLDWDIPYEDQKKSGYLKPFAVRLPITTIIRLEVMAKRVPCSKQEFVNKIIDNMMWKLLESLDDSERKEIEELFEQMYEKLVT